MHAYMRNSRLAANSSNQQPADSQPLNHTISQQHSNPTIRSQAASQPARHSTQTANPPHRLPTTSSQPASTLHCPPFSPPSAISQPANSKQPVQPTARLPNPLHLAHGKVDFVDHFTYLGSTYTTDGSLSTELHRRTHLARAAFTQLDKLWRTREVRLNIRMLVYRAIIPPTLLYGCETWPLTPEETRRLNVVQNDCMRTMLTLKRRDHIHIEELQRRCQQAGIQDLTRKYRLRFAGHLARRPDYRLPKQLLFAKHVPGATAAPRTGGNYITSVMKDDMLEIGASNSWYKVGRAE